MSNAATAPAETRKRLLFTGIALLYGLVVLFPVLWLAQMMVKPADIMFARPTAWLL